MVMEHGGGETTVLEHDGGHSVNRQTNGP
jgi:hypothetical protein